MSMNNAVTEAHIVAPLPPLQSFGAEISKHFDDAAVSTVKAVAQMGNRVVGAFSKAGVAALAATVQAVFSVTAGVVTPVSLTAVGITVAVIAAPTQAVAQTIVPEVFNSLGQRNADGSFDVGTSFVGNKANWSYTAGSSGPTSAYDRVTLFSTFPSSSVGSTISPTFSIESDATGGRTVSQFAITLGASAGGLNQPIDVNDFRGALVFLNRNTGNINAVPLSTTSFTISSTPIGNTVSIGSNSGFNRDLYLASFTNRSYAVANFS